MSEALHREVVDLWRGDLCSSRVFLWPRFFNLKKSKRVSRRFCKHLIPIKQMIMVRSCCSKGQVYGWLHSAVGCGAHGWVPHRLAAGLKQRRQTSVDGSWRASSDLRSAKSGARGMIEPLAKCSSDKAHGLSAIAQCRKPQRRSRSAPLSLSPCRRSTSGRERP